MVISLLQSDYLLCPDLFSKGHKICFGERHGLRQVVARFPQTLFYVQDRFRRADRQEPFCGSKMSVVAFGSPVGLPQGVTIPGQFVRAAAVQSNRSLVEASKASAAEGCPVGSGDISDVPCGINSHTVGSAWKNCLNTAQCSMI